MSRCGCGREYSTLALGETCCQPFAELDTAQGRQLPLPILSALISTPARTAPTARPGRTGPTDTETEAVVREVVGAAGYRLEDLLPVTRLKGHVIARRAAMLEAWRRGSSHSSIARVMGRDHSSVMTAVERGSREAA